MEKLPREEKLPLRLEWLFIKHAPAVTHVTADYSEGIFGIDLDHCFNLPHFSLPPSHFLPSRGAMQFVVSFRPTLGDHSE